MADCDTLFRNIFRLRKYDVSGPDSPTRQLSRPHFLGFRRAPLAAANVVALWIEHPPPPTLCPSMPKLIQVLFIAIFALVGASAFAPSPRGTTASVASPRQTRHITTSVSIRLMAGPATLEPTKTEKKKKTAEPTKEDQKQGSEGWEVSSWLVFDMLWIFPAHKKFCPGRATSRHRGRHYPLDTIRASNAHPQPRLSS